MSRAGLVRFELKERADADALLARRLYAGVCREPEDHWTPVEDTADVRHLMVDFYDTATGRYGQALGRFAEGGDWRQAPVGERPVLLVYRPPREEAAKRAQERGHGYRVVIVPAGGGQ